MFLEFTDLGGVEVDAALIATLHDVIASFIPAQAAGARVGFVRVDAVSNSADWEPAVREFLDP